MSKVEELNNWLISEGRLLDDEIEIVKHYCEGLVELGVPLARARIAQTYSNPLLSAWGVIWTPTETHRYMVPSHLLQTTAWYGSPFEFVVTNRKPLRKKIMSLNLEEEHTLYSELAETGATDFLAMPLEYGDGSVQGTSFTTMHEAGYSDDNIRAIEQTRYALAAALEPIAMRESQKSLLQTYLGFGPAIEIGHGRIKRGEHQTVSAAILFADLRDFTSKSELWSEHQLLNTMGDYFEIIINPIHENGGDVLKFMGDGVLAIFVDEGDCARQSCASALKSAKASFDLLESYNSEMKSSGGEVIDFVISVDFGEVTFGNIGSPSRLDFTVVGRSVNIASRVQELCKELGEHILFTSSVASHLSNGKVSVGKHSIRGVPDDVEIFRPE